MKRFRIVALCGLILSLTVSAWAAMDAEREITLDFTDTQTLSSQVEWSDPQYLVPQKDGFRLVMDPRDGVTSSQLHQVRRDIWIQTTEPIAIGWSWRPVSGCSIAAERIPAGEFKFTRNSTVFPSGSLYVRYSPDAVHWSTWQNLAVHIPKSREDARQEFTGTVRIPEKERAKYQAKTIEYMRMDVPWGSDEEAAVKWILSGDPDFFARQIPFIGYLQFLYEESLAGDGRLGGLKIRLGYGAGGLSMVPKDESVEKTHSGPWRFKGRSQTMTPGSTPAATERYGDFEPLNRIPVGMALSNLRDLLLGEGFEIDEEPTDANGWLSASKHIGPEDMHHIVRAEFKSGQLVSVTEMGIDP